MNFFKILDRSNLTVICDDHATNVKAYDRLSKKYGSFDNDLFITIDGRKIYLLFDPVHLVKNVRNNLFPLLLWASGGNLMQFPPGDVKYDLSKIFEKLRNFNQVSFYAL